MVPPKALTGTAASRLRSRPRRSLRLRHLKREEAPRAPLPHPLGRRHPLLKGPLRHLPDLFSRMTCPRCANQTPPHAPHSTPTAHHPSLALPPPSPSPP